MSDCSSNVLQLTLVHAFIDELLFHCEQIGKNAGFGANVCF